MDTTTYTFKIDGMHCGSCALLIDDVLTDVDGVASTETSMKAGRTVVRIDPDRCAPDELIKAIAELGYVAAHIG